MPDQLTFELETGLPRLPARLRPMLPQTAAQPFDSPAHLFEPSWGGRRALAFIEPLAPVPPDSRPPGPRPPGSRPPGSRPSGSRPPGGLANSTHDLRLVDVDGRDVADLLPELADLPERVAARSAILDGELVVVDQRGRPDHAELARRLDGQPGRPVVYLAFDLLYLDGRPLLAESLERRRALLGATIVPGTDVVALPSIVGEGLALYDAAVAQGIAGVMCRERRSPYLPGIRSRLWQFVSVATSASQAIPLPEAPAEEPTAPVLALIRRLPLDE